VGASAVLVFAVPNSPLAQPWAVVGGNTVSALVGVLAVRWLGHSDLAAGLAVGAGLVGIVTQSDVVAALSRPAT
jgi:CBS domain-containing membrane protein